MEEIEKMPSKYGQYNKKARRVSEIERRKYQINVRVNEQELETLGGYRGIRKMIRNGIQEKGYEKILLKLDEILVFLKSSSPEVKNGEVCHSCKKIVPRVITRDGRNYCPECLILI